MGNINDFTARNAPSRTADKKAPAIAETRAPGRKKPKSKAAKKKAGVKSPVSKPAARDKP